MQINYLSYNPNYYNNYKSDNLTFGAKGKPLSLKYIMEHHSQVIPKRVRTYVQELLDQNENTTESLLKIHEKLYRPILSCKTFADMIKAYPEFSGVLPTVPVKKSSVNSPGRMIENFGLNILQEYWGNLKTKDEIAQMLGMRNRNSLEFSLKKINFIGFDTRYKTLLKASDEAGNRKIAEKTKAWNKANPEKRRELNKIAAQGCKTDEYRKAQSQRMYEYDAIHPERREKISKSLKGMWDLCPEVKLIMSQFSHEQQNFVLTALAKQAKKQQISEKEDYTLKIFYKKFWTAYPQFKDKLSLAAKKIRENKG